MSHVLSSAASCHVNNLREACNFYCWHHTALPYRATVSETVSYLKPKISPLILQPKSLYHLEYASSLMWVSLARFQNYGVSHQLKCGQEIFQSRTSVAEMSEFSRKHCLEPVSQSRDGNSPYKINHFSRKEILLEPFSIERAICIVWSIHSLTLLMDYISQIFEKLQSCGVMATGLRVLIFCHSFSSWALL